jgi:hypothetical protein
MGTDIPRIRSDRSNCEESDLFYEVANWQYDIRTTEDERLFRISHPRSKEGKAEPPGPFWAEVTMTRVPDKPNGLFCESAPKHLTRSAYSEVGGDLFGRTEMAEFVIDSTYGLILVSHDFRRRLEHTRLRGYEFVPFAVVVNQSQVPEPRLFVLQGTGRNCERPLHVFGGDNLCPFCKEVFIVCDRCGWMPWDCPTCGRESHTVAKHHKGPDDKRVILDRTMNSDRIVDVSKWDGADFFASHLDKLFVTKRVWDWVVAIHAGPLMGRPARICLDAVTVEQRKWLAQAADVATVEK